MTRRAHELACEHASQPQFELYVRMFAGQDCVHVAHPRGRLVPRGPVSGLGRSLRLAGGRREERLRLPGRDEKAQQLHRQRIQAARKRRLRESTFTGLHVRAWMTVWQGRHSVHSRGTGIRKSRNPTRHVKPLCAVRLSTQHADAVVSHAPAEDCF